MRALVDGGEAQFWAFQRSACVTEINIYPRAKHLNFWLTGGDLNDLLSHLPEVEAWGRALGCTRATGTGRPGWDRVMSRHGYTPTWRTCTKDL